MQRGSQGAVALPLLVASSGCASWADVLSSYRKTCELLRGVYQPTTEELYHGLSKMETSWSASLFYYGVIKGTCGYRQPPTRLVSAALERFKRSGNFYAIKRVMEEDVDTTTNEGARSMLVYASFTGMWENAMALYASSERMQNNLADTRILVNILAPNGRWDHALQLLYRRSPPPLSSMFVKPIVRSLGLAEEYDRMFRLVAASLAQGHKMDVSLFSALLRSLQREGRWRAALETAEELGIFSLSREIAPKHAAVYGGLCDCLYLANPYFNFTLREIVDDITSRMRPRNNFTDATKKNEKKFRLITTNEMFRSYKRYVSPLSSIYVKLFSLNKAHHRPVSELADEALKHGDTLLVLDTNFLLQCTAKDLPLSHFYPPIRRQYPHLEGKPLEHLVIPFTTVREIYQIIWSPSTQLKRAVRNLLWSRVATFLKQPSVTVLTFASEFPCISFSAISNLAYLRLNEPAEESDPDLRILNTCLALQHTLRLRKAASLQGVSLISEGTMLFSFLKYHVRRHHRDVRGIATETLLLCTLDKRLSAAADELGIQTFPQFHISENVASETTGKQSFDQMSTKEGVCRICHRDRGRLVSPCTCEGSMKYVHSRCLSDWVYHRRSLSCEVCGTTYSAAKVFNFQLSDGAPGFFILCWICARHYMKRYFGMLTFAVLHTLVVIFIPFIVAFFHYALPPSDPFAMRWHPVIQLLPESGPFSPQIFFAVGAVLTLCAVPLFLLWNKWQEWLALGEGDVLGLDFGEEEEAAQQPSVNPVLVESDEEVDEEPDEEIGGQRLVPASLPEENATVFEAITLLRQKSKDHFGGGYLSSKVFHSSLHFILFYAAMWTFLKFVPEIMRLTAAFLWNFFDGGSYCNAAFERVLQLTAISEGNSRMRHAMIMLFVDALGSSTLISWSIVYVRRSFSLWCIFWLVKYLRRLPHRKTLSFLILYFRGILNVIALTCYGLLTVCFLMTLICLEFFVAETSFASNDYETAWKIATGVSSKKMDHALALGHRPQVVTGSSPLTMLKALSVLSGVHENDTCGNFGDVQTRLMTTRANISDGFNRIAWVVDGDDPLLLPLFIATVFVSKVDSVSIVEMGYMAVYFALFLPCMARFLIQTVPVEWLSWSSLYRLLHSNLFEGIRFCDLKALIFIYGEILLYTVVCSFTLLRCSLALVRVINPSLVPIALLANTSIPSFACWMRLSLLCYTTHRDVLEGAYKLLTSTLENVFNIRQVMHGGSFSLPRVLSRAVRVLAFVIFYWLVTVVTLAAHAIPGLHVLGKRGSLVRLFLLFDVQLHIILYSLFPLGFPQQGGLLRVLSPRIGLLLAHWKHRWWFGSCLGLWLDSSEVRAGNRLGYSVRSIRKVPGDVGSRFLSSIDAVLVRLEEYKKGPRGTRPIERLQETLNSLASKNDVIYFFLEEDVRLLLECMNPPTIQQVLCYILNCVVLLILQPFFSGAAWVVMVRRFFFKPHCNVGVDAWFILLAWFCGVAITVSLCTMRVKVFGAPKRLLVYLFCGCQHFTIKNAMAFILIPHFMHIASISFVPYTLHNLLCFLLVSGGRERYWTGHVFYYVASTVLLGTWSFLLEMREIERRYRNKLRGVVEGGAERLILPRVLGHSFRVFLLDTPADGRARVRDGEVAPGPDVGVGAPQQIHDVEDFRGKIMGNARAFLNSVTESAVRFLRKVAERQNVMGVVFVDHPSVSA